MGVIKRQGIKNSIVSYIGVVIGAVNVLFIYPLAIEVYGLARFMIDTAMFLTPFVLLGTTSLTIRYFPTFRDDEKGHHGFLLNLLIGAFAGMILFSILFFLFRERIFHTFEGKELISDFLWYLIPLTCLVGLIELLTMHISNFHRIVIPAVLNLSIKFTLPALILLFYHQKIGIPSVIHGVLLNFFVVLIALFVYLKSLGQLNLRPDFGFLTKDLMKDMGIYAFYGVLGLLGAILATRIDTVMIGAMLGEYDTGTYSILLFIANVIEIPRLALMKITTPIVANAWSRNDMDHLNDLYKRSALNLLIPGILLFVIIFSNIDSLLDLMPKGDQIRPFKNVVLVISMAKLVDMATSINNQVIAYSRFYKFNFYAILIMAALNVFTNLMFIPAFQILGAAMATLVSLTLYNLAKCIFAYMKFGMHPFTSGMVRIIILGTILYFLVGLLPPTGWPVVDILIRTTFAGLIYGGVVLYFKWAPDVNDLLGEWIGKWRNRS